MSKSWTARSRLIAVVALALSVLVLFPAPAPGDQESSKPVKIGVLAIRGVEKCLAKWGPTAEYLTEQVSKHSFVIVPLDFEEVCPAVEHGEVDFVLANSSFYVELEVLYGVSRLVTLKNLYIGVGYTRFGGVIFQRADRDKIKELADLKGKTFMAAEETSFGGWQTAWREMKAHGIDPYQDFADLRFGGTHDAVVYAVRDGKVDAGTVRTDTLERMAQEGSIRLDEFRVIYERGGEQAQLPFLHSTRVYPEWPLAKVRHISDELAEQVAVALVKMPPDSPVAKAAKCAGWTVPLNYQPVHECLKELRIGPYKDLGEITFGDVVKRYWPWIASIIILLAGMAVIIVWVLRLLSERKRAEEKLRESEDRFRQVAESSAEWIWEVDAEGRYTYSSSVVTDLLGYEPDELIGRYYWDLFRPEDREAVAAQCREVFTKKQIFHRFLNELVHKEGQILTVETTGMPILNDEGTLLGYRGVDVDVTERIRAEEQLRLLSQAVDSSIEGIAVASPEHKITYVNESFIQMFGYSREELLGKEILFIYSGDQKSELEKSLKATIEGGWTGELIARRKNGECFPLAISSSNVVNDEGHLIAHMTSHRDITERKRAEEQRRNLEAQVQHAQKLESLGVLAGGIAHDFNNLLVGILGNADLALDDLPPGSPARISVKDIETAAKRAADLARQMLAYSGKGRFVVEALSLNEIVEEMTRLLEVSISKNAILKYNFAVNLPAIEADGTQIRQVIMNLITNASEAIGDRSGVISISTGAMECDRNYLSETYLDEDLPNGVYTYIEVADTGCGMDEETRQRVFEPFFTTKFTGRGLGLAAVLGIIRGHKGALKVYSEPGRGTTFKALFPATDKPVAALHKEVAETRRWHGGGIILLVDDEETVRAVGKRMLERLGFAVLTASDGHAALGCFKQHTHEIVCVILDLTMPHMDGEEVFRELRRIRGDVNVIISSGYNEQEVTQRFAGKGLAGFIQKPYRLEELISKLREALE